MIQGIFTKNFTRLSSIAAEKITKKVNYRVASLLKRKFYKNVYAIFPNINLLMLIAAVRDVQSAERKLGSHDP